MQVIMYLIGCLVREELNPCFNPWQAKAIEEIYRWNPLLKNQVRVVRIGWTRRTLQQGRIQAALHIKVASPEQANILIKQGLYLGESHYRCEPFFRDCQVNQCAKCYRYSYIAKYYSRGTYCSYCACKGHASELCPKKDVKEA